VCVLGGGGGKVVGRVSQAGGVVPGVSSARSEGKNVGTER
jgi:hypothetical protein